MNSELYLTPEILERIFSKTADNLELKFDNDKLKVKGKKIFSFEADVVYKGIENDEIIFEFQDLQMKSLFAKAGMAFGGDKLVDAFAKSDLPEFVKLEYPYLKFSLEHVNISKRMKLTELIRVKDVKFGDGIRIILE